MLRLLCSQITSFTFDSVLTTRDILKIGNEILKEESELKGLAIRNSLLTLHDFLPLIRALCPNGTQVNEQAATMFPPSDFQ